MLPKSCKHLMESKVPYAFLILLFMSVDVQSDEKQPWKPSYFADRAIHKIFEQGLISTYFERDVREIAQHYVRRSRFSGNVRINLAPRQDALNIYIFHYHDSVPSYFRNNCSAFPQDQVILCDHKLLDSIPDSVPFSFVEGSSAPAPSLMYWLIGHEIGHVVLRHDRASFLGLSALPTAERLKKTSTILPNTTQRVENKSYEDTPNNSSSDELRAISPVEVDADRFALAGLPVKNQLEWMNFGNPIVDAILWELPRLVAANTDGNNPSDKGSPEELDNIHPEKISIAVRDGYHPPIALRLYDFVTTIEKYFSSPYPFADLIGPKRFDIEYVDAYNAEADQPDFDGLFYKGFYLGSDDPTELKQRRMLDKAVHLKLENTELYASGFLQFVCTQKQDISPVWKLQQALLCEPESVIGLTEPLELLSQCKELGELSARCYALLPLYGVSQSHCKEGEQLQEEQKTECVDLNALDALDAEYAGYRFEMEAEEAENLIPWMVIARYRYELSKSYSSTEAQDKWFVELLNSTPSWMLWQLMQTHADYLNKQPEKDVWTRKYNLYSIWAQIAEKVENDVKHLEIMQTLISLADLYLPLNSAEHGALRLMTAKIMLNYRLHSYGSGDPLLFLAGAETLLSEREKEESVRRAAGAMSEEAAKAFLTASKQAATSKNNDLRRQLLHSYLVALNDSVFAYNLAIDFDAALGAANNLQAKLSEFNELQDSKDYNERILAPALENIAYSNLASSHGDNDFALLAALKARDMRMSIIDEPPMVALRAIAYGLYAKGEFVKASEAAKRFIGIFETSTGRRMNLEGSLPLDEKYVSWQELLNSVINRENIEPLADDAISESLVPAGNE